MISLDIRSEAGEVAAAMKELGVAMPVAVKRLLRALATAAKKRVKRNMGKYLHNRTGDLKAAIYGFRRSEGHAVVAAGQVFRSEILERGGVIKPKKGKYLTFRGDDGSWHKAKMVTIPARRFFSRSIDGFESDPEFLGTADKIIAKEIRKAGLE